MIRYLKYLNWTAITVMIILFTIAWWFSPPVVQEKEIKKDEIKNEIKTRTDIGTLKGETDNWNLINENGTYHLWLPTIERAKDDKNILPVDPAIINLCLKLNGKEVIVTSREGGINIGKEKGLLVISIKEK